MLWKKRCQFSCFCKQEIKQQHVKRSFHDEILEFLWQHHRSLRASSWSCLGWLCLRWFCTSVLLWRHICRWFRHSWRSWSMHLFRLRWWNWWCLTLSYCFWCHCLWLRIKLICLINFFFLLFFRRNVNLHWFEEWRIACDEMIVSSCNNQTTKFLHNSVGMGIIQWGQFVSFLLLHENMVTCSDVRIPCVSCLISIVFHLHFADSINVSQTWVKRLGRETGNCRNTNVHLPSGQSFKWGYVCCTMWSSSVLTKEIRKFHTPVFAFSCGSSNILVPCSHKTFCFTISFWP